MSERFTNKIAIITGGAMGIGKGIAEKLGREKAMVVLLDNNRNALQVAVAYGWDFLIFTSNIYEQIASCIYMGKQYFIQRRP